MDTNVNYKIVGAFVITLVIFIVLAVTWLSAGLSISSYSTFQIKMQESVSGLSIDAPVEYNGVSVGSVSSIALNHTNPHLVDVLIKVKTDTPINKGTVAMLNTRGLTGIAYLSLEDKGTDLTPLKIEDDQPYPVIKTAPSLFLRWDNALSKLGSSISDVSHAVEKLLDAQNQQSIKQILINLNNITKNFAAQNQKLNLILENTAQASYHLSPMLTAGKEMMQTIQTQTLPATNHMINNLDTIVKNLTDVSASLKQNPAVLIRGQEPQPLGPGEK